MVKKLKPLSVDLQKDFSEKGGICYLPRPSVDFVKNTLIPFFREKGLKCAEIISDYRQPRPGDRGDCCHPGTHGYESEIPADIKEGKVWVKCMNSPVWIRENAGDPEKSPGLPYPDPSAFGEWLKENIGEAKDTEVVLFGLTADCCVLCTAQELKFRGYKVYILSEATDTYSGDQNEKKMLLSGVPVSNWAEAISWEELKERLLSV
ncbi:MAG: isochorismatase family protein [bacterium]